MSSAALKAAQIGSLAGPRAAGGERARGGLRAAEEEGTGPTLQQQHTDNSSAQQRALTSRPVRRALEASAG